MKTFRLSPLFLAVITLPTLASTEELIVTGSYSPVTNEQLSSSVSIINKEQLLQLSNHSLIDALRQVPSLWVEEQGGPGGITSIALRGAEANHTLVLLDGVQLNDPTNTRGGGFDLNGINIESIERIEIIRGAQSAVYGSDALAGVIHIITQTPGKKSTTLNASLGSDDYSSVGVSTSGSINKLSYAFSLQGKDAGEPVVGSTAKNTEFTSRLNWQHDAHAVNFSYRYFDGERTSFPEQSGGPEFSVGRDLDMSDYKDQSAAMSWVSQVNHIWKSKVSASWYERDEDLTSPGIIPFDAVPPNGSVVDFNRTQFSWINTLGDQQKFWANIGVETKKEDGASAGYLYSPDVYPINFALDRQIDSAFINLNTYATEAWLVQASIRRDDAEGFDANDSGQIGTKFTVNDNWTLFANWGEGFKLPSFFALGHPLVGNADLQPETVTTRDAGFEFNQNTFNARVSYFDHHYRNLIDFDSATFKNVNRSRVETSGVESEFNWQVQENLSLRAHATYTDIDMISSDNHLLGRPQVTYGTSINYALNDAWSFNAQYMRVDERFAVSRYTGTDVEQTLNAYNRFDASAHWTLNAQLQLGLSLENLADEDYYTDIGFPAAGRSAKINVKLNF
ncbi:TonB-dependent receptor plug domain-containing protein [Cellvibrio sp. OA-2007]|uniref:TonB-dependent receptor plug domain-containing protein n=1 Tax=Cellvibrio sp. OA-2007 TaxID=529823 RepID=UPI000783FE8C|nr:TonB-dependent receptor [Cellvibrio sp. OA-2007]